MGDEKQVAMRSFNLVSVALARNDLELIEALLATILPRFREYNHRFGLANVSAIIGSVASRRNDLVRAHHYFTESLAQFEELEYPDGIAMVNDMLGHVHRRRGDGEAAERCLRRALHLWRIHVGRHRVAHALRSLAMLEADRDHLIQAINLAGAAATLSPSLRYDHLQWVPGWFDSRLEEIRATIGDEQYSSAWTEGTLLSVDEAVALLSASPPASKSTSGQRGSLSPRGREVLRLVAAGRTNTEIASLLGIGHRTVEHHLTNAYAALDARGRAEAVKRAIEAGLLNGEPFNLLDDHPD
jgi:DNA-binding CsgD family transcriptional regulator